MSVTHTDNRGRAKQNPPAWLEELSRSMRERYERVPDEMDHMPHPSFTNPNAEETYFGAQAAEVTVPEWEQFPEVPEELPSRGGKKALSKADEQALFLRYNYARARLGELLRKQRRDPSAARAREIVAWHDRVTRVRGELARANMALVVAMCKRTRIPNVEFAELVSEGNMALLRALEKFDASRGFKFSTYACRAILKSFNRLATKTGRYRQRFPVEYDPELEKSDYDVMKHDIQHNDTVDAVREVLSENRANLSDLERTIVMERFAIGQDRPKGRTLAEVGKMVGLTNERVRQIQKVALVKLRTVLDEEYLVA